MHARVNFSVCTLASEPLGLNLNLRERDRTVSDFISLAMQKVSVGGDKQVSRRMHLSADGRTHAAPNVCF
jgi:hypothetical protein